MPNIKSSLIFISEDFVFIALFNTFVNVIN